MLCMLNVNLFQHAKYMSVSKVTHHKVSEMLTTLRRKKMIPKIVLTILAINFFVITGSILRYIADERIGITRKTICHCIIAYTVCAFLGGLCVGFCSTIEDSGGLISMIKNPLLGRNTIIGLILMFAGSLADLCMYISRKEPINKEKDKKNRWKKITDICDRREL